MPETRYSKSADGVHIAYQVLGEADADLDLVVSPGFVSHLEHSWEEPHMARFLRRLASFSRLIVFDKRGTGMSDRPSDERAPLLEDRVGDIASLMDTVGSERAALMGLSETSAVALLFAATYPERTRAVIAYGSYAGEGDTGPTYPWVPDPEAAEWLEDLERNWGRGVLYLEDFAPSLVGDALYEEWYAKLERLSVSPGAAVSLVRMALEMDVRDILPTIRVPTLVLHKRDDRVVPLEEGKYIADHIPGATFVELPGRRPLAVDRSRGSRRGDPGVPHRHARQRRAGTRAGDRDVHRHRRLDETCGGARGPAMGGSARDASTRSSDANSTDPEDVRSIPPVTGSS